MLNDTEISTFAILSNIADNIVDMSKRNSKSLIYTIQKTEKHLPSRYLEVVKSLVVHRLGCLTEESHNGL